MALQPWLLWKPAALQLPNEEEHIWSSKSSIPRVLSPPDQLRGRAALTGYCSWTSLRAHSARKPLSPRHLLKTISYNCLRTCLPGTGLFQCRQEPDQKSEKSGDWKIKKSGEWNAHWRFEKLCSILVKTKTTCMQDCMPSQKRPKKDPIFYLWKT